MEIQDIVKFLINPILYVLVGLVLIIFIKKNRLKLTVLVTIYFYVISISYTGQFLSSMWKIKDTFNPDVTYDAVVVLAGVSDASWYVNRKNIPYIPDDVFAAFENSDKIFAGINFVKSGHARLLLIGEWIFDTYNEANVVKKLAKEMGLKENQICIYGRVKRTLNEVEGVKVYIEKNPIKKTLLVTSELDMRRALAMFRKQGLNPDIFSTNKEPSKIFFTSFIPSAYGLKKTYTFLYEFVAYIGYYLKGDL